MINVATANDVWLLFSLRGVCEFFFKIPSITDCSECWLIFNAFTGQFPFS